MNLLQIRDSGAYSFHNKEVQAVFEISREIFEGRFDVIMRNYKENNLSPEILTVIGTITGAKGLVEQGRKGEVVNVCKAIEELEKRCYNDGKREGYDSGHSQCLKENISKLYQKGFGIENISELLEIPKKKVEEICGA